MTAAASGPPRARLWSGALQVAALLWLGVLGAVNVYRAATQSITADEAFTYNHFAGGDEPVRIYDANNHVLFTWLVRLSTALLGLSEFSVRLPSVAAGWAYLAAVYFIARRWFARPWLFATAVAALSLNPFVLDFLSAARGYGLALALFAWGLDWAARDLEDAEPSRARWRGVAVCLALAVAANLNFVVPGSALAAAFCALTAIGRPPAGRRMTELARFFLLPGMLLAVAILAWPLRRAEPGAFYYGVETLRQTVESLVSYSFYYGSPENPTALQNLSWNLAPWWALTVLAAAAAVCAWRLARLFRLRARERAPGWIRLLLLTLTACGALGLLVALKNFAGLKYPVDRTALYWIPLLSLIALGMADVARSRPARVGVLPLPAFLVLACVQYALQFNTRYYALWRYDSATREMVEAIREREARHPRPRVRIGASGFLEPSLNFYRQRHRLNWLERITRDGPRGEYDYYLLIGEDVRLAEEMNLEVLRRDALAGAVLAAPRAVLQSRP